MFSATNPNSNEVIMNQLRMFSTSTSQRGVESAMAELWRRGISQTDYIAWLKKQKEKETND
jgi:hypothetical protein